MDDHCNSSFKSEMLYFATLKKDNKFGFDISKKDQINIANKLDSQGKFKPESSTGNPRIPRGLLWNRGFHDHLPRNVMNCPGDAGISLRAEFTNRCFHKLYTIQECQYCQLCFCCAICNLLDH